MTHVSDLFDPGLLREMIDAKMIRRFEHNNGDLIGLEYTQRAQWDRCWNDVTLQCRGLLATTDGTVIARPFPKFFNLSERPDEAAARLGQSFTVSEKLDGSLGIHYRWQGQDHIATRGSFHSLQAEWATEHAQAELHGRQLNVDLTHLFEIIYPANRVVVDYGGLDAIVFLAALNIETGDQVDVYWPLSRRAVNYEVPAGATPADIGGLWAHLDTGNFEGFVVTFTDGYRVKVKLDEYLRLHRIMSSTSNRTIWEALRAGTNLAALFESVPDEFYRWSESVVAEFNDAYDDMQANARHLFDQIEVETGTADRKAFAMMAKESPLAPVLFAILDEKDYADTIWKRLRPDEIEYPPLGGGGAQNLEETP